MNILRFLCGSRLVAGMIKRAFTPRDAGAVSVSGIQFSNPVGLGAGFDKNARYLRELGCLGFGFVEVGTVTPLAQEGNPKPRLFRLKKDRALINRMGFNNDGVKAVAERLRSWRKKNSGSNLVIGGNIGKNKITPNEEAVKDYEICFRELHPYVDYFVVNVSSPNTPGLRELQEKASLHKILTHLQAINLEFEVKRPLFLKIAPDLSKSQVDDVIDLAKEINLDGIVASNTTISRDNLATSKEKLNAIGAGGLSGGPLKHISAGLVKYICEKAGNDFAVIASGGIEDARDARERFHSGAVLIQVWTGFIYEGPGIVRKVLMR